MATNPKAGVLTSGEVSDVKEVMDALSGLNLDRCCTVQTAVIQLDTERTILLAYNQETTDYEVSLA